MTRRSYAPAETFRIHPWLNVPTYFSVHVAENRAALDAVCLDCFGWNERPSAAVVNCSSVYAPDLAGFVLFSRDDLGAGIVAHEMGHAAARACERRGWRHAPRSDARRRRWTKGRQLAWWARWWVDSVRTRRRSHAAEEVYCEVLESLTRQCWKELYARNIVR